MTGRLSLAGLAFLFFCTITSRPAAARSVGNPFLGAQMYVNPDYQKAANASMAKVDASSQDAQRIRLARNLPTAIWLDRMAALYGGSANAGRYSLLRHLRTAVAQASAAHKPGVITLVVYDLPNRDCAALASNGELQGAAGLATYKAKYIDEIYSILTSEPQFAGLRFALVIEPDSLPNMVTNTNLAACAAVAQQKLYEQGVTYAIKKLGSLPNAFLYLDMGHSGWLGWPSNMQAAVAQYASLIKAATADGKAAIRGMCTDVSNYTPWKETGVSPSQTSVLSDSFYQWNPMFDESTFIAALSSQFAAAGLPNLGFLTDSSRNGWRSRGSNQPTDARKSRGNWCNVKGAGMGARPQAAPSVTVPQLDAFVFIKPPGESDGSSDSAAPVADGKRPDPNCSATNPLLDGMANAPTAGTWFHDQYLMLLRNATPPLL
jgi:cellulose 1,4-beta-cellobiosidase